MPVSLSLSFSQSLPQHCISCFVPLKTETTENSPKIPAILQCQIPRRIQRKHSQNFLESNARYWASLAKCGASPHHPRKGPIHMSPANRFLNFPRELVYKLPPPLFVDLALFLWESRQIHESGAQMGFINRSVGEIEICCQMCLSSTWPLVC